MKSAMKALMTGKNLRSMVVFLYGGLPIIWRHRCHCEEREARRSNLPRPALG
jgi:hypothetical protein